MIAWRGAVGAGSNCMRPGGPAVGGGNRRAGPCGADAGTARAPARRARKGGGRRRSGFESKESRMGDLGPAGTRAPRRRHGGEASSGGYGVAGTPPDRRRRPRSVRLRTAGRADEAAARRADPLRRRRGRAGGTGGGCIGVGNPSAGQRQRSLLRGQRLSGRRRRRRSLMPIHAGAPHCGSGSPRWPDHP